MCEIIAPALLEIILMRNQQSGHESLFGRWPEMSFISLAATSRTNVEKMLSSKICQERMTLDFVRGMLC